MMQQSWDIYIEIWMVFVALLDQFTWVDFWMPLLVWTLCCWGVLHLLKQEQDPKVQYITHFSLLMTLPLSWFVLPFILKWRVFHETPYGQALPFWDERIQHPEIVFEEVFRYRFIQFDFFDQLLWSLFLTGLALIVVGAMIRQFYLLVLAWWRVEKLRKTMKQEDNPSIREVVNILRYDLNINRPVNVFITDEHTTPFTFGWLRPVIVVPRLLLADAEKLYVVLSHEFVHIRRHDAFWQWVENTFHVLFSVHPFVHKLVQDIRFHRETSCDVEVITENANIGKKSYARILLDLFEQETMPSPLYLRIADSPSALKNRILALKNYQGEEDTRAMYSRYTRITLALIATSFCVTAFQGVKPFEMPAGFTWQKSAPKTPLLTKMPEEKITVHFKPHVRADESRAIMEEQGFKILGTALFDGKYAYQMELAADQALTEVQLAQIKALPNVKSVIQINEEEDLWQKYEQSVKSFSSKPFKTKMEKEIAQNMKKNKPKFDAISDPYFIQKGKNVRPRYRIVVSYKDVVEDAPSRQDLMTTKLPIRPYNFIVPANFMVLESTHEMVKADIKRLEALPIIERAEY